MLQFKQVTITHKKDLRTILQDFNFTLNPGDKAAIIGEEGNGKSTLLKLAYDEALVQDYAEHTGEINKKNMRLGYLAQEFPAGEAGKTVLEYFSECPAFYEFAPNELSDIARKLGMSSEQFYSDQLTGTLSGGEKVKLQLARILMEAPDALLLDEPSNDLDLDSLKWLEAYIAACEIPVLFISHDETFLERTANVIIHIELVRRKTLPRYTVAKLSYSEYVKQRSLSLARQEQRAENEKLEYEKQQERFRRIQTKVEHQQNAISRQDPHGGRLLKKKMKAVKSMEKRFDREDETRTLRPDTEDAILLRFGEGCAVPAGKTVLDFHLDPLSIGEQLLANNIDLTVTGAQKICIIGKNGTGKTTLLRKIAEDLLSRDDIRAAYMPQNYREQMDFSATPPEFLAAGGDREAFTKARTYLGNMKFTPEEMEHPISELSGGQKAKLFFLKMVLTGSNVLILDEPTRNFSPLSGPVIREVLEAYPGTIISVSHDRKYIAEVCDQVYQLKDGGLTLL